MFVNAKELKNGFPLTPTVKEVLRKLIEHTSQAKPEEMAKNSMAPCLQIVPIITVAGNTAEVYSAISLAITFFTNDRIRNEIRRVSLMHGIDDEDDDGDSLENALSSGFRGFIVLDDPIALYDALKELGKRGLDHGTAFPLLAIFKESDSIHIPRQANKHVREAIQTPPVHQRTATELRQLFDYGLLVGWKELCQQLPGQLPEKFKAPISNDKLIEGHVAASMIGSSDTIQDLLLLARKTTWAVASGFNETRKNMHDLVAAHLLAAKVNPPGLLLDAAVRMMRGQVIREQPLSSQPPPSA